VDPNYLQLLGTAALFIACKYEETGNFNANDFALITDFTYNKSQILMTEAAILKALGFRISFPTVHHFLLQFLTHLKFTKREVMLTNFISERCLQEYRVLRHRPSKIAACSIYFAMQTKGQKLWDACMFSVTDYREEDLADCLYDIKNIFLSETECQAVSKKFRMIAFSGHY